MSEPESENLYRPGAAYQRSMDANEMDLADIVNIFKKYSLLMLGIVLAISAITVGIAFMLPKVYRAEVIINPPLINDVEQLNIFDIEGSTVENTRKRGDYFFEIPEDEVYDKYIRFLNSKQLQYTFFEENNLVDLLKNEKEEQVDPREIFQKEFSEKFSLVDLRAKNNNPLETVTISLDGRNEQQVVAWLNAYVAYIDTNTVLSIINGIKGKAQLQINGISKQIVSLREVEKSRRLDLIEQYKEALAVADTIGMTDQMSFSLPQNSEFAERMNATFNPGDTPLYLRGSKALRAELTILQQRKNDDPFIDNLRDLQQRLAFLSNIHVSNSGTHAASIDQLAFSTGESVKPNKPLIVVIGVFFGCLVAIFTALIKNWQTTMNPGNEAKR